MCVYCDVKLNFLFVFPDAGPGPHKIEGAETENDNVITDFKLLPQRDAPTAEKK